MSSVTVDVESTAQAYLRLLHERGIEYFFGNAGTDFASIIDAFGRSAATGEPAPTPITVPHEVPAVAMAYGYYMVTGRPQAVMVHVNVGTANALSGIINAMRDGVPILFTAGRTPITEAGHMGSRDLHIHWAQESFDQAAMVREYVKWDYELRNFDQLEDVVDRALSIAMTEPRGPVYLTLPREVLAERQNAFTFDSDPRGHAGRPMHPNPDDIQAAASMLAASQNPLIITTMSGRFPGVPRALEALAESFAIPVVEFSRRAMCLSTAHPMHLGFTHERYFKEANALLIVDSDVPWFPAAHEPRTDAKVIHLGVDPAFLQYPMRSFPCDLAIQAHPTVAIDALTAALAPLRPERLGVIESRYASVKAEHEQQRSQWRAARDAVSTDSPIDPLWLSHCIDAVKDDDTIVVNEYDLLPTQAEFTQPGTFFGASAASGLGWGLGAALGAKLASRERLVIATVGDGAYMFGNPTPCHFVARAQGLPTLTVIFNNGTWGAVQNANRMMYPEGWASKGDHMPLSKLEPSPDYELLAVANGGYGEQVEQPDEVIPALERALHAVRVEHRLAVLNVICKTP